MSNFNFNFNADGSEGASVQPVIQADSREREIDPRIWKPELSSEVKTYSGDIRILPESNIDANTGMDNLNGYPSKLILMHRLRMGKSKHLVVKCLKRDKKDKTKGVCPYCDWAWNRFWLLKNADAKTIQEYNSMNLNIQEEIKKNMDNMPYENWVCNVLVVKDNVHPEFNGQVKIWPHTQKINDMLDFHKDPCGVDYRKRLRKAKKNETVKESDPELFKNVARFTPEHPLTGHTFTVVCNESSNVIDGTARALPTYENSSFSPVATPLANSEEEMIAILNQRHDLNDYAYGDIPSYKDAQKKLDDWLVSASVANVQNGAVPLSEATVVTQQNYSAVMSNAPAPTAKPMEQISGASYAQGYTPNVVQTVQPNQPQQQAAAQSFSIPAAKFSNQTPEQQQYAQPTIVNVQPQVQPQNVVQQQTPQYNIPGQTMQAGGAVLDDDELPF